MGSNHVEEENWDTSNYPPLRKRKIKEKKKRKENIPQLKMRATDQK